MLSVPTARACDMCRDATPTGVSAVPNQAAHAGLAFNSSIYFMLASLMGTSAWVGRTVKRSMRDQ